MAGLAAAWELSRPENRDAVSQVTVYQRGWRLGGKGASSRGAHGRIEEHGLHVWLGYYDNAFRLVREVYDELDRERHDPGSPISTWRQAFVPSDRVGVADPRADDQGRRWHPWVAAFRRNDLEPGDDQAAGPVTLVRFAERALTLVGDLWASLDRPEPGGRPSGVYLSASPEPPRAAPGPGGGWNDLATLVRRSELAALSAVLAGLAGLEATGQSGPLRNVVADHLGRLREELRRRLRADDRGRRLEPVVDLVVTCLRGMAVDGLTAADRFPTVDDQDFRAWLARHGAAPGTLRSPLVTGMYDLVFAYEEGDPDRPAFSAGLGLFLAAKLFFDYKGSVFWKMRAGMGDVVFAPLYQALRARGVRFEFFTQVEALRVAGGAVAGAVDTGGDGGGARLVAIELARQARPRGDRGAYDPLVRVRGLPCFPAAPDGDQLAGPAPTGTESHGHRRPGDEAETLMAGRDFDIAVLATSLGVVPQVAADIVARDARWRRMVERVATVPTQSAQLWLTRTEAELGWPHGPATVSGGAKPFDTYASMGHLLPLEDWPDGAAPRDLVYMCSVRDERRPGGEATARRDLRALLDERIGDLWPRATDGDAFDGRVLHGGLGAQFVTASTDRSERYVQSLPGSGRHRLRVDESGVAGLVLAGDWTRCGLDAGCIEAAVLSGLEAANAVLGRPLLDGVIGSWYPLASVEPGTMGGQRAGGAPRAGGAVWAARS